jgi:hypothetical protein
MPEEELKTKVLTWLSTQGYGTEMKVATAFTRGGFEVGQSWFYSDPDTSISREIDIFVRLADMIGLLGVYSTVECKKSSKPWVLFTTDRAPFNRINSLAIMSDPARQAVALNIPKLVEHDWIRKDGRLAYGITEAFTSKEDDTFKAAMTATKAAIAMLNDKKSRHPQATLEFYFPTVVFDGVLFECYLEQDSNPVLREIDSAFLLYPVRLGEHSGSSVRIVTLSAIDRHCAELKGLYKFLKRELQTAILQAGVAIGLKEETIFLGMQLEQSVDENAA